MMQALSAANILKIWEQGSGLRAFERALLVLDYGCPEHGRESSLDLSLGARDRLLFDIYRLSFGDTLDAYTECPSCQERLEFSLSCSDFLNYDSEQKLTRQTVFIDGVEFSLRPPNSRDAAAAALSHSVVAARQLLLTQCATPAADCNLVFDTLPESTQEKIAVAIAALDPQAELLMDLVCPACHGAWQGVFEVNDFVWAEIRTRAKRLLQHIDALARVYGWREADILALSETRRNLYVQMAVA
jgi:hypothetical protein